MNSKNDSRIRTGSLALRIALGNALRLVLFFAVVDLAVIFVLAGREAAWQIPGSAEAVDSMFKGVGLQLSDMRFGILIKVEGVMILISLLFDIFRSVPFGNPFG